MFVVWGIVTSISALMGRYWFPRGSGIKIHMYIQQGTFLNYNNSLAVIFTAVPSFVIALYAVKVHYRTTHSILGTIFLIFGSIQGSLGSIMVFKFPFWNVSINLKVIDTQLEWLQKKLRLKKPIQFPEKLKQLGRVVHPILGKILFFTWFSFPSY